MPKIYILVGWEQERKQNLLASTSKTKIDSLAKKGNDYKNIMPKMLPFKQNKVPEFVKWMKKHPIGTNCYIYDTFSCEPVELE